MNQVLGQSGSTVVLVVGDAWVAQRMLLKAVHLPLGSPAQRNRAPFVADYTTSNVAPTELVGSDTEHPLLGEGFVIRVPGTRTDLECRPLDRAFVVEAN
jgi:hypothetical protein